MALSDPLIPASSRRVLPLVVSGSTPEERGGAAEQMRETLATISARDVPALCLGRLSVPQARHRGIVLAGDHAGFDLGLARLAQGRPGKDVLIGQDDPGRGVVFAFPGQAASWGGMASGLYRVSARFRDAVARAGHRLAARFGWNPADIIAAGDDVAGLARIQPVQFVLASALAELWEAFGVAPAATLGHSVGEAGAAHLAGYLDDAEAADLLAMWGDALGRIEGHGAMASLAADEERARALLAPWRDALEIAAFNSPRNVTLSGGIGAIDAVLEAASSSGIWAQTVPGIAVAGHSRQVESVRDTVMHGAPGSASGTPVADFWSTVLARAPRPDDLTPEYWYRALRQPVLFEPTIRSLGQVGHRIFIELSAHPVLTTAIEETLRAAGRQGIAIASLDRRRNDRDALLHALARAYVNGVPVRWSAVWEDLLPALAADAIFAADGPLGDDDPSPMLVEPERLIDDRLDRAWLATRPVAEQRAILLDLIVREARNVRQVPLAPDTRAFAEAGFSSLELVEFIQAISAATGLDLPTTILYDHASPNALIAHLRLELGLDLAADAVDADAARTAARPADTYEPIAILGMACRYPGGVSSPDALWDLVRSGRSAVGEYPTDRSWDTTALYDPEPGTLGRISSRMGGFLEDAPQFDATFFGIAPREAAAMEPQQRLLLETAWEAIERAGIDPAACKGRNIGVFAGVIAMEYGPPLQRTAQDAAGYAFLGTAGCVASGRIAYALGLEGPALTIDTACSSSLVAIHTACEALRSGDCDFALAGGATIMSTPGVLVEFSRQRVLASDGHCKAFSAGANGIGLGEGVGMLLLAPLSTALERNLPVLAVIRGSAVNQDGASNGLSAPSGVAQQRVIRRALARAGLRAAEVDAIEAHGTGTRVGDPIEAHALLATYGQDRADRAPAYLGSIKSNIGHAQAAAGVAGVIKMVMAMRHGQLPPSLHIDAPSDAITWANGRIDLLTRARDWPQTGAGVRRAAVSAFGVSGTNGHLILESPPEEAISADPPADLDMARFLPVLWPLSAKTPAALRTVARRLHAHVLSQPDTDTDIAAIARTLGISRGGFPHRAAVWGRSRAELLDGLEAFAAGREHARIVQPDEAAARRGRKLVFVFPGQGSQWPRMGMELFDAHPVFRESIEAVDAALLPFTGWSVLDVLRGTRGAPSMERVDVVQPALFAVMVSLARVWQAFGITPAIVMGHSQGEIVAAHVAGVLDLPQAARIVALRSRLLQTHAVAKGALAMLLVTVERARALIAPYGDALALAVFNSPRTTGISGDAEAINDLVRRCADDGIQAKRIAGDVAPHAPRLAALRPDLLEQIGTITPQQGAIAFHSTVEGHSHDRALDGAALDAAYWCDNLCRPVRFADTVAALAESGDVTFLECSPHPVLLPPLEECVGPEAIAVPTLQRIRPGGDCLAEALGRLYVAGHQPDWTALYPGTGIADLPTYPFERQRYWIDAAIPGDVASSGQRGAEHKFLSAVIDLPDDEGMLATGRVSLAAHPWLADHGASGIVILPGMAYLDIVLQGARLEKCDHLAELTLHAPMVLTPEIAQELRLKIGRADEEGDRAFKLHARPIGGDTAEAPGWTLHASGHVRAQRPARADLPDILPAWPPADAESMDIAALRERLVVAGYDYGPAFRGLERAWRRNGDIFVEASLPDGLTEQDHVIHPALLDAALHPIALDPTNPTGLRLPFSLRNVVCHGRTGRALRARLRVTAPSTIRITAFGPEGTPLLEIESLTLREAKGDALRRLSAARPEKDLLETVWSSLSAPDVSEMPQGMTVIGGAAHPAFATVPSYADMRALGASLSDGRPAPDLILWPIDDVAPHDDGAGHPAARPDLSDFARRWCEAVTVGLQTWLAEDALSRSRLVIIMRHAIAADRDETPDPAAASVWQLLHSAQNEHPERLMMLDVAVLPDSLQPIASFYATGRPQAALRGKTLLFPTLRRVGDPLTPPATPFWRLDVGPAGGLESLLLREAPEAGRPLEPDEIRIAVRAAGLNFYDTAYALGLIPLQQAIGAEVAGLVAEVGPSVTRVAVGDRVMAMTEGGYGPFVVTNERLAVRIGDDWTFAEAAATPAAFVTAYRAITEVAAARRGEKILIHAGAGGVGQAAIQIARHLGLEIFATAHPSKWPVLRALGLSDDHIASSRDLSFTEAFRAASGGHGMDVVLNSLAGAFTDATFDLTAPGGRIVELGKSDIRPTDVLAQTHPLLAYRHLDARARLSPDRTAEVLDALRGLFDAGCLTRLPVTAYDLRDAESAFRLMQYGRHTGKIVLTLPRTLDPSGSVLITGGTGQLGGLLARHLVADHEIRSVILISRQGARAPGAETLRRELEVLGASITIMACDTADRADLHRVFEAIPPAHPLTGVFHAAGALSDATITRLTPDDFRAVFRPKTDAAWLLHEMTRTMDLAAFVLYSSTAGTLGNPGQGNYAAANAFLDALAHHRNRAGLPARAVGWGWWQLASEMSHSVTDMDNARIARSGLAPIAAEHGNALMDAMLRLPHAALLAAPVDIATLRGNAQAGTLHPLFAHLAGITPRDEQAAAVGAASLRARLARQSAKGRARHLLSLVRDQVAAILGLGEGARVDADTSFRDAGLDSLMALELRNRVSRATGLRLPATLSYDQPTPAMLAAHLDETLFPGGEGADPSPPPDADDDRRLRDLLMALPVARLREAGLLEPLLRLGGKDPKEKASRAPRSADRAGRSEADIRSASTDELLAFALLEEGDDE